MGKWHRTFKQNDLFRPDPDRASLNACVGNNGGPYDLYDYAHGYFDATQNLLQSAGKSGSVIDLLVYPICLNFRHAIELFIKYLIADLARIAKSDAKFRKTHPLEANWSTAMNLIKRAKFEAKPEDINLMTKIVTSVMEVDPKGDVFRYPESIKGDQHLKDWAIINLAVLGDVFSSLLRIVEDWHHKIEDRMEDAAEQMTSA